MNEDALEAKLPSPKRRSSLKGSQKGSLRGSLKKVKEEA